MPYSWRKGEILWDAKEFFPGSAHIRGFRGGFRGGGSLLISPVTGELGRRRGAAGADWGQPLRAVTCLRATEDRLYIAGLWICLCGGKRAREGCERRLCFAWGFGAPVGVGGGGFQRAGFPEKPDARGVERGGGAVEAEA